MRRAVVFIGGSRDIASALQRAVSGNVRTLARAGVVVPRTGRRATRLNGLSHQKLATMGPPGWQALKTELAESAGDTVLLVVPAFLRMGDATARHRAAVTQLSAIADEVWVVSVVADQLRLINEYYIQHIATWRFSGRLESIVPKLFSNEIFVHERLLRPWYDEDSVRYVALPYDVYAGGGALGVVLGAAGVTLPDAFEPVAAGPAPPALGSVGVEANRLLSTFLRAEIPDFRPDAAPVAEASRVALARVEGLGWCSDEFWGWTARAAEKALARFDASNHRFARTVWGTDWTLPYPVERASTQVDLLDLEAAVVEEIQQYVFSTASQLTAALETAR